MNAANLAGHPELIAATGNPVTAGMTPAPTTWTPDGLFPGMTSDATSFTIPLSALEGHELYAADVDPVTGDARQMIASIEGRIYEWYKDLQTKPVAVQARRNTNPQSIGQFAGSDREFFTVIAYVEYPNRVMSEEPPETTGSII